MKNNPASDNKLLQSFLNTLVEAGWVEKSVLVDSGVGKRGKVDVKFTKLGAKRMAGFNHICAVLKKYEDLERHQLYAVLEHWNSITPPE